MKYFLFLFALPFTLCAQPALPVWTSSLEQQSPPDWLLHNIPQKAGVYRSSDNRDIILFNGLVKRAFRVSPNLVCFDYRNCSNGQQLLRSILPEAVVIIDGTSYAVGGLYGQKEKAYLLPDWLDTLHSNPHDFYFTGYTIQSLQPLLPFAKSRFPALEQNKPGGVELQLQFRNRAAALNGILITVHYALYDGLPLTDKWLTIEHKGQHTIHLNRVKNELLAMVEEESAVVGSPDKMTKPRGIYFESNYAFNNAMRYDISDQTTHWKTDSTYTSQVNYNFQTPCLLEVYPEHGPGIDLPPGETFTSIHTFELLMDSYDRERRGLMVRRMYRTVAPWTTENPIFMHLVSHNDAEVRTAIDQCAAAGYEAVILSFGSHLNLEDSSADNIRRWKSLADYAHSKHIGIGGYSLFSSRHISDSDDVISPVTGKPGGAFFGHAPCFGSKWGLAYRDKIEYFFAATGFDIWENDGPYPGDVCASTTHPGHKGLDDSQWRQMEIQKGLYHWLHARGVYINAPDWYFLDGTNKIAIGYREVNFSLPRDQQIILNRQNIYDGTWEKTPAMGWGFVPLTRYQGGGPEAVLEPLKEHLKDYRQLMFQYYGAGVQACYRGPRLYDADTTLHTVQQVIRWYKKYRSILNADILHLRRADGRDWDGILHVDANGTTKAMLILYNPLHTAITRSISLPLYYTGLTKTARLHDEHGKESNLVLDGTGHARLQVTLPPDSGSWWTVN